MQSGKQKGVRQKGSPVGMFSRMISVNSLRVSYEKERQAGSFTYTMSCSECATIACTHTPALPTKETETCDVIRHMHVR